MENRNETEPDAIIVRTEKDLTRLVNTTRSGTVFRVEREEIDVGTNPAEKRSDNQSGLSEMSAEDRTEVARTTEEVAKYTDRDNTISFHNNDNNSPQLIESIDGYHEYSEPNVSRLTQRRAEQRRQVETNLIYNVESEPRTIPKKIKAVDMMLVGEMKENEWEMLQLLAINNRWIEANQHISEDLAAVQDYGWDMIRRSITGRKKIESEMLKMKEQIISTKTGAITITTPGQSRIVEMAQEPKLSIRSTTVVKIYQRLKRCSSEPQRTGNGIRIVR